MILFSKVIYDSNVENILKICKDNNLGISILEFAHLIAKRKIQISETAFIKIVDGMKNYKGVVDEIEPLCRDYIQIFKWDFTFSMIEPYIVFMIK